MLSGETGGESECKNGKRDELEHRAGGCPHSGQVFDFEPRSKSPARGRFFKAEDPDGPSAYAETSCGERYSALRPAGAHAVDEKHRGTCTHLPPNREARAYRGESQ